jgi:hypothetical protein
VNDHTIDPGEETDQPDGPSDEVEPGRAFVSELDRLARHPRTEVHRLEAEADKGEVGATPYIEVSRVAVAVVLIFLLMLGIALTAYYVIR